MSIYSFLNPESEKRVTGDLTDEEIIAMVHHHDEEPAGVAETQNPGRTEENESDEEMGISRLVMSNQEALTATQGLIQKLLEDEEIEKTVLKAVEPLRMLERTWRVQRLRESTVQSSLLSYFTHGPT